VVSEVVSQTLASMLEASDKTVGSRLRSSKVNQVQGAAGFEYPPCLLQCLLLLVCLEVVEHEGGKHSVERRIRIWKLLRVPAIQLHGERISLKDVARAVSLSPGHLTTVLRRKTGRTVQEWIAERRMVEARRLLVETDLSVEEVGRRVGYGDAGYFVRSFRRAHGATPLGWRRAGRP